MITFENSAFLLLLIPLLLFQWQRPFPSRSANVLQFFINLLLVGALSGMNITLPDREGVLFILCDRSLSMPEGAEKQMEKQISIISRKMKNTPGVISFAGNFVLEQAPGSGSFKGFKGSLSNRNVTLTGDALSTALRMIPKDTPGRILLISDGSWNGSSPERAFSTAVMRRIPVDFLPLKKSVVNDFAITGVSAPQSAAPGEYCSIVCQVYAPRKAQITCRIRKNNGKWQERQVQLHSGNNRIFWRDRSAAAGVNRYDFSIVPPEGDEIRENNFCSHLIETRGTGKLLLLTNSPSGNLGKFLAASGFEVETAAPPSPKVSPETLSAYNGVILENVPASSLTPETNALMAELVRTGRMGLLMTGGRRSFAVGGWYKTPVGEILPLALEKQHDIRQRRSAVMMALDRSGSMAATVDGVTKMAMANLAASESYRILSPLDEFGLVAVDSSVHEVVPLGVKKDSPDPTASILAIESMGGGIFVDKALHEGVRQLMRSSAPVRHLLLFADAADAEQPGNYKELLDRAVKAGITVSVVGLGERSSVDAPLLMDIARRGKGKCYFADNASELPRIFAEDTFVMARSAFVMEKTAITPAPGLRSLHGAENIQGTMESAAYNLCFLKDKSTLLLKTPGPESVPIAATGYAGLGKTAALTVEADGEFSGKFSSDPRGRQLLAALTRHVVMPRRSTFRECFITQTLDSGIFISRILLDPERKKLPFTATPVLSLLVTDRGGKLLSRTVPFRWEGSDSLIAEFLIPPGGTVNAAVDFGGRNFVPLAPVIHTVSPEFLPDSSNDIASYAARTGGRIKSSFDDIGASMKQIREPRSCRPWLLGGALLLLLCQVWMRRSGREFPQLRLALPRTALSFRTGEKKKKKEKSVPKETPAHPEEKQEKQEQNSFSEALKRAKRR